MKNSFGLRLMCSYIALVIVAGGGAYLAIEHTLSTQLETQLDRRLETQARAVAQWIERARHYDRLAPRLARVVNARVTIVDTTGHVMGDSDVEEFGYSDALDTTLIEFDTAVHGGVGRVTRWSSTRGQDMRYVAVPAPWDLVVRLGVPTAEIAATQASLRGQMLAALSLSLVIAAALGVLVARTLSRRLMQLCRVAEQIGRGNYDTGPPLGARDELGVLSQTLHMTANQLCRLDEMRREFLSDVAHELRTPVTSIRGYAETLLGGPMDEDTGAEFLQVIHRNSLRIARLVDDLLLLQALEDGVGQREPSAPVAVAAVMDNVRATAASLAEPAGARLDIDIPAQLTVVADADGLEQILQNLVDNAIKHGGASAHVRVHARRQGQRVAIVVADSGPGIAAQHLPRIFERFYRVAAGRSRERGREQSGSGLGLAIARKLAESMGGRIEVRSQPGVGTTFTVDLPG